MSDIVLARAAMAQPWPMPEGWPIDANGHVKDFRDGKVYRGKWVSEDEYKMFWPNALTGYLEQDQNKMQLQK